MNGLVVAVVLLLVLVAAPPANGQSGPADACATLMGRTVQPEEISLPSGTATVASARLVLATPQDIDQNGNVIPEKPDYCEVVGAVVPVDHAAPAINFQLNLPLVWNGKALQYGGLGSNGTLTTGLNPLNGARLDSRLPVTRGYATYGTDSGHQLSAYPPTEFAAFALNDESLNNFAYAAYKKVNDVARAVIRTFYGQSPSRTYYFGFSEGGREGLAMAQRFPNDYDGIVSIAPDIGFIGQQHAHLRNQLAQMAGGWISPKKIPAVATAVSDACDALDGLADGVVSNYLACPANFDPESLRCPGGGDTDDVLVDPNPGWLRDLRYFFGESRIARRRVIHGE